MLCIYIRNLLSAIYIITYNVLITEFEKANLKKSKLTNNQDLIFELGIIEHIELNLRTNNVEMTPRDSDAQNCSVPVVILLTIGNYSVYEIIVMEIFQYLYREVQSDNILTHKAEGDLLTCANQPTNVYDGCVQKRPNSAVLLLTSCDSFSVETWLN